jgi:hypothetical protein
MPLERPDTPAPRLERGLQAAGTCENLTCSPAIPHSALLGVSPLGLPHSGAAPLTGINRDKPGLSGIKPFKIYLERSLAHDAPFKNPRVPAYFRLFQPLEAGEGGGCVSCGLESKCKRFNSVARNLASQPLPNAEHN